MVPRCSAWHQPIKQQVIDRPSGTPGSFPSFPNYSAFFCGNMPTPGGDAGRLTTPRSFEEMPWIAVVCSSSPVSPLPVLPPCRTVARAQKSKCGAGLWSVWDNAFARARFVSLSHVLTPDTPVWNGFPTTTKFQQGTGRLDEKSPYAALHLRENRPRNHGVRVRHRPIRHAARPARALASMLSRHR